MNKSGASSHAFSQSRTSASTIALARFRYSNYLELLREFSMIDLFPLDHSLTTSQSGHMLYVKLVTWWLGFEGHP